MKNTVVKLFFLLWMGTLQAQGLRPGQKIPSLALAPMTNYPTATANISDWKGKLLILDFWSLNCGSCIAAFPHLEKLQEQFDGKIQILLVSKESKDSLMRFFAKRKRIKIPDLPMLTSDTILNRLFPHAYSPYHVWIDGDQNVKFRTEGYNATEANLQQFLNGQKPAMAEIKFQKAYRVNDPLFLLSNDLGLENLTYYSFITHYIPELDIGNTTTNTTGRGKPNLVIANAHSIVQLFARAYSAGTKYDFYAGNSIILEVKDTFPYKWPKDFSQFDEWKAKYCYNYVLQVPVENADELFPLMQEELCRYFKLSATIEKRKVKCLVLVRTSDEDKLASKSKKTGTNFWTNPDDTLRHIYNGPFYMLPKRIKEMVRAKPMDTPLIDATGYKGNVDIEISNDAFKYKDINLLRKELQRYDLDLREQEWETDVLVIRER